MEDPKDQASNSHKTRAERARPGAQQPPTTAEDKPEKVIERVVTEGGVVEQKKSLGRKFRDLVVGADAKGAASYVIMEVLIPAARGMAVEVGTKFVERIFYPDSNPPGRRIYGPVAGSRVSYSNVGYRPPATRPPMGGQRPIEARLAGSGRSAQGRDYVIASRIEANAVVERMGDLLDIYNIVTVADLHDLIGIESVHTDNKWGWDHLRGVGVKPVRDGFLITLPPPEPVTY